MSSGWARTAPLQLSGRMTHPGFNWRDHPPFAITPPGAAAGSHLAAVDRTPNNLDVFWVRPDGAIGTQWWVGKPGLNWGDHQPFTITPPGAAMTQADILVSLRQIGIDFSVPEKDLRDWLGNPTFTPYPAIAGTLLNMLDGKSLRQPVFLDVIVFNYEHAPGAVSPRMLTDVDPALLMAAVVEGYNTRYGESETSFQSLVR